MTYNQIRIVKRLLAVVLVCFGGFVSYQLYVSLDKRQSNAEIPLSTEPDDPLAKGVELTQLDSDGKRAFVLRAALQDLPTLVCKTGAGSPESQDLWMDARYIRHHHYTW